MRVSIMVLLSLVVGACWSAPSIADKELEEGGSLAVTVKLLQEQMSALLDHRQEDYNALEESLRQSVDKNTELRVLKAEIKQLRKEMSLIRSANPSIKTEAFDEDLDDVDGKTTDKNERLKLRWLATTVTELRNEFAEVMRTRNADEEQEDRAKLKSEVELLRADVAGFGRGVRDLGGRLARVEASVETLNLDLETIRKGDRQLAETIADIDNQLSDVQNEVKSIKRKNDKQKKDDSVLDNEITSIEEEVQSKSAHPSRHILSRLPSALRHLDERMSKLEHKIGSVSRKRALLEKRVVYEDHEVMSRRLHVLESIARDHTEKIRNISKELEISNRFSDSVDQMFESLGNLEEMIIVNQSDSKREIARLDVAVATKAAELTLIREELGDLKTGVVALTHETVRIHHQVEAQQDSFKRFNQTIDQLNLSSSISKAENVTKELEHVEDEYRKMVDSLPGNCNEKDGLTLLAPGPGAPLLAACRKGWIVVGRRVDGTVNFDRTWNDYAQGFGSPMNEFWAGNEALYRLSRDNCTRLRIELNDIDGNYWVANYENFSVGSEETGYRLRVSDYSGNATDAMSYQNNMAFSAKDRDMDISSTDCAANYHGGWWFSHCQHANLNGRYSLGLTWYRSDSNQWMAVASTELSVQRKQQCL